MEFFTFPRFESTKPLVKSVFENLFRVQFKQKKLSSLITKLYFVYIFSVKTFKLIVRLSDSFIILAVILVDARFWRRAGAIRRASSSTVRAHAYDSFDSSIASV